MVISNEVYETALKNKDNIMIMHSAASKFLTSLNKDELHRCKLMALWKTLKTWDSTKGAKFTSSLYQQVRWECLKNIYSNKKNKNVQIEGVDRAVSPDTQLYEIFDGLPPEMVDIIEKRHVYGMTLREIGDEYGYCYETIRKRLKKAYVYIKIALKT